jgi:hypothetical protein
MQPAATSCAAVCGVVDLTLQPTCAPARKAPLKPCTPCCWHITSLQQNMQSSVPLSSLNTHRNNLAAIEGREQPTLSLWLTNLTTHECEIPVVCLFVSVSLQQGKQYPVLLGFIVNHYVRPGQMCVEVFLMTFSFSQPWMYACHHQSALRQSQANVP